MYLALCKIIHTRSCKQELYEHWWIVRTFWRYKSGNQSWPQVFNEVRIAWSVVFCGVFCRSLFVSFLLAKGLFVRLWFFGFWLPDLYLQNVLTIHQCSYNSCLQDRVWIILQRARYILVNYHTILKIWYHYDQTQLYKHDKRGDKINLCTLVLSRKKKKEWQVKCCGLSLVERNCLTSGTPEVKPSIKGVLCSSIFSVVSTIICLYVHIPLVIVLSVLQRKKTSYYSIDNSKSCVNEDMGSRFFVYTSKLVQF
jgi:hypothetical protein